MKKMRWVLAALVVAGVSAQYNPKCEVPKQLSGRYTAFDPNGRKAPWNKTLEYYETGRYFYDAENLMKAEFEEHKDCLEDKDLCHETDYVGWIYHGRQKRSFVLNLGKDGGGPVTCVGYYDLPSSDHFEEFGPAPNSTFSGFLTQGAYPEELNVMEWISKVPFRDGSYGIRTQFFAEDGYGSCIPTKDDMFSHDFGFNTHMYFDNVIGILDPNVFYPKELESCQPFPKPGEKDMLAVAAEVGATQFVKLVNARSDVRNKILNEPNITVLAPSDKAIKAAGSTLSGLTSKQVEELLFYHVIPVVAKAADLKDKEKLKTDLGQEVTVHVKGKNVYFSGSTANDLAQVLSADNEARNGVLHLIDEVLLPSF